MNTLRITWAVAALVASVLGAACSTPGTDAPPMTVSVTRILQYPGWVVRAAVPDAFAQLGVGQLSYSATGKSDSFQGVTDSGMSVSMTAESTSDRVTVLKVLVVGTAPSAEWLVNAVPDTVSAHAYRLEPTLSKPGSVGGEPKP